VEHSTVVTTSRGPLLILTGPPGAGKTAVARLLVERSDRAVHLESDRFFHFIVSGYVEPWKPESHGQNAAVMRIVGEAAVGYRRAGYETIVDGIIIPGWFFEPLRDSIRTAGFEVAYAVLRPPLAVAVERAAGRSSSPLSDAAVVQQLWNSFSGLGALEDHAIDNGEFTAEQTADIVAERLHAGTLTTQIARRRDRHGRARHASVCRQGATRAKRASGGGGSRGNQGFPRDTRRIRGRAPAAARSDRRRRD
jgi:predicted kinase